MRTNVAWKGMSLSMMGTKIVHRDHSTVQLCLVVDTSRGCIDDKVHSMG